ncbi:hypothetical protein HDE_03699 [Halotydeus destructor]|nr:hypothetical protein HDE_03699 [Halotydeus destructor]
MQVAFILLLSAFAVVSNTGSHVKYMTTARRAQNFTDGADGENCAAETPSFLWNSRCLAGGDTCCWKTYKFICTALNAKSLRYFNRVLNRDYAATQHLCQPYHKDNTLHSWYPDHLKNSSKSS